MLDTVFGLLSSGRALPLLTVSPSTHPLPASSGPSTGCCLLPSLTAIRHLILASVPLLPLFSGLLPHSFLLGTPSHQLLLTILSLLLSQLLPTYLGLRRLFHPWPTATSGHTVSPFQVKLLRDVCTLSPSPPLHSSDHLPLANPQSS